MQVGDVVIRMAADLADLRSGFDKAKEQAGDWGNKLKGTIDVVTGALAALGVAASVGAFTKAIRDSIDYADNLNDLSQKVGITVETLGGLEYAAKQSGADLDTVAKGAQKLAEKMADASSGNKEAAGLFDRLGISIQNTDGSLKPLDDTLLAVADRFAEYKDGPEKAALAQDLFSKGGAALIPMLNQGGDALRAAIAEYRTYGGVSTETAQRADAFNDTLAKLDLMSGAFTRTLAAALLPVLQSFADILVDMKGKGSDFGGVIDIIVTGVKVMGIAVIGAAEAFNVVGKSLGALAAAAVALASGDFSRAWSILKEGGTDAVAGVTTAIDRAKTIWSSSTTDMVTSSVKDGPAMAAPIVKAAKDSKDEIDKFIISMEAAQTADELGLATNTVKQLDLLAQALDAGKISRDQYNTWMDAILDKDPILKAEQDKLNAAMKEAADVVDKLKASWDKELGSLDDRIRKQVDANTAFGLGKAALIDLEIAHLDEKIAVEQSGDAYSPYADHLIEVRDRMYELRDATAMGEALSAQKKNLDDAAKAWDKFIGDVSARADDFVSDVIEDGWGAAFKNLWSDFKKWAISAFAEIASKQIVVSLAGSFGLTGGAGANGLAGGAAGGGGGGIFDSLMNAGTSLAGTFSGLGGVASTFMSVLGTGAPIGQAFSSALATTTLSLGSIVPVVGGIIAAGTMLYNWLGSSRGGPKEGGFASSGATPGIGGTDGNGRWFTPSGRDSDLQQAVNGLDSTFTKWLDFFGGTGSATFAQGFSTDPQGKAPSNVHTGAWVNGQQVFDNPNGNVGRDDASLQAELETQASRAILAALQASSLPDVVGSYLASIDVSTATVEQINAALAHAADLKILVDQVSALPVDMANGLLAALGLSDALDAKIRAFASAFGEFSKAADKLQDALDRDPKAEALNSIAAAHASTFEKVGLARDALSGLLTTYDGTTASTELLAVATNAYVDAQVAALIEIEAVRTGLAGLFGDTIRNMDLALLSADQQKTFYLNEALAAQKALETATDPAEIDRLGRLINTDLTAAFRLMDPKEQERQHDYIKGILTDTKTITDRQLDASADLITESGNASGNVINLAEKALTDAGEKWKDAAQDMMDAAADLRLAADAVKQAASDQAAASANTVTAATGMNTAATTMQTAANTPQQVYVTVESIAGP